ncbi:unnamed protein product [Boreogadus saida]
MAHNTSDSRLWYFHNETRSGGYLSQGLTDCGPVEIPRVATRNSEKLTLIDINKRSAAGCRLRAPRGAVRRAEPYGTHLHWPGVSGTRDGRKSRSVELSPPRSELRWLSDVCESFIIIILRYESRRKSTTTCSAKFVRWEVGQQPLHEEVWHSATGSPSTAPSHRLRAGN